MKTTADGRQDKPGKQSWEPIQIRELGELSQVIRSGGGKLSQIGGDPGENRKQPGGG